MGQRRVAFAIAATNAQRYVSVDHNVIRNVVLHGIAPMHPSVWQITASNRNGFAVAARFWVTCAFAN